MKFKPGDIVEWVSPHHNGRGSLGVVIPTPPTGRYPTGVSVTWITVSPDLQREFVIRGKEWALYGWADDVFQLFKSAEDLLEK